MPVQTSDVVSAKEVYEEFVCGYCKKLVHFQNNTIATCGHVFCSVCFQKNVGIGGTATVPCLTCAKPISPAVDGGRPLSTTNPLAERIFKKIRIRCPLNNGYCKWTGTVAESGTHVRECIASKNKIGAAGGDASANAAKSPPTKTTNLPFSAGSSGPRTGQSATTSVDSDSSEYDSDDNDDDTDDPDEIRRKFVPPARGPNPKAASTTTASAASATSNKTASSPATAAASSASKTSTTTAGTSTSSSSSTSQILSGASKNRAVMEAKDKGAEFIKAKDYRSAATEYSKAIMALNASDGSNLAAVCHTNRAWCRQNLGAHKEAISDLKESIRLDDSYGKAYHRLGIAYLQSGEFEEAQRVVDNRIVVEKEAVKQQQELETSKTGKKANLLAGAFKSKTEKNKELQEKYGPTLPALQTLQVQVKQLVKAVSEGKTAIETGKPMDAVIKFRKAVQVFTTNHTGQSLTLQTWLARALFAAGNENGHDTNHAEVRRITQNILRDNRDFVEGLAIRALTIFAADEADKAQPLLKEALRLNPDCAEARQLFKLVVKPVMEQTAEARELVKKFRFREAIPVFKEVMRILEGENGAVNWSDQLDPAVKESITRGLRRSTLLASVQVEYAAASLKIREFKAALAACNSSLRLYSQVCEQTKTAYLTRCNAYLEMKQLQEAANSMKPTIGMSDDDDRLENMRNRAEAELKKGTRPDYYRFLSESPSVQALLNLKEGECWKTCGSPDEDTNSDGEELTEEDKNRKIAARITQYSQAAQMKTAYRRRCLELHPDKQQARLHNWAASVKGNGRELSPAELKRFSKNTEEHFKLVQEAYDILSDTSKKRYYDSGKSKDEIEELSKAGGGFSRGGGFGFGTGGFNFRC
ncbi:unnamed protein product [Amoebophrya sp. A25]|nr:unnamed protein product [Amoebophrya sp. A25]|eukprot:GSA25T00003748001.1